MSGMAIEEVTAICRALQQTCYLSSPEAHTVLVTGKHVGVIISQEATPSKVKSGPLESGVLPCCQAALAIFGRCLQFARGNQHGCLWHLWSKHYPYFVLGLVNFPLQASAHKRNHHELTGGRETHPLGHPLLTGGAKSLYPIPLPNLTNSNHLPWKEEMVLIGCQGSFSPTRSIQRQAQVLQLQQALKAWRSPRPARAKPRAVDLPRI